MKLWQEIIFLQNYCKTKWVVENVIGFYKPFIPPYKVSKHYFWSNFFIRPFSSESRGHMESIENLEKIKGFDLSDKKIAKRMVLRNCVEPETGLWVFQEAFKTNHTLI